MLLVRRLLARRRFAAWLCAATLLLKLLVPTGYMVGAERGRVVIELCPAAAPQMIVMPGMRGEMPHHGPKGHAGAEMPCAFSGLSAAALGAADPIQLAALIAFVMAAALVVPVLPAVGRRIHLRPPLRGPPILL